jgi:hypothetical protein
LTSQFGHRINQKIYQMIFSVRTVIKAMENISTQNNKSRWMTPSTRRWALKVNPQLKTSRIQLNAFDGNALQQSVKGWWNLNLTPSSFLRHAERQCVCLQHNCKIFWYSKDFFYKLRCFGIQRARSVVEHVTRWLFKNGEWKLVNTMSWKTVLGKK